MLDIKGEKINLTCCRSHGFSFLTRFITFETCNLLEGKNLPYLVPKIPLSVLTGIQFFATQYILPFLTDNRNHSLIFILGIWHHLVAMRNKTKIIVISKLMEKFKAASRGRKPALPPQLQLKSS